MIPADLRALAAGLSEEDLAAELARLPRRLLWAIDAEGYRSSFAEFVRAAWPLIEPGTPLVWSWHIEAICRHLEEVAHGRIKRLVINVPPRSGKSNLFAILWPAWVWTFDPGHRFLFLSYALSLSIEHSVKCRQVIASEWYQQHFAGPGGWQLAVDQNVKHDFANTKGGRRIASSIEGGVIGRGGDTVGIDDPLNANEAYSEAARERAKRLVAQAISSRLNDPAAGRAALIMQRLHEDDPTGFVLSGGDKWQHLMLPSEFESERRCVTYHLVGQNGSSKEAEFFRDPRQAEGDLLWPQRFSAAFLASLKQPNSMGEYGYAGQHQQRPAPLGGGMFKRADWRFYRQPDSASSQRPSGCDKAAAREYPRKFDRIIVSVDGTFKKTASGSYVAIHVWGAAGARRLLLERVHDRMDYDACEQALVGERSRGREFPIGGVFGRWPAARERVVEDAASGPMLVSRLTNVLGIPGVIAEPTRGDSKEQRASVYSLPYQRAGNCELPDGAPWLDEYVSEHALFPAGRYNDDVDAQSQALRHLEGPKTTMDLWTAMEE